VVVENEVDMDAMLNKGLANRTTGSTLMNAESSRSHSIFTIVVEMNNRDKQTGKDHIRAGKLNLVDLAGSERQKKTGATGDRLKEGSKINLSLSALGNVISALSDGAAGKHIPYRDSKLTRMLQDSLGGNTKTLMVAAISPADYNYDETLSTLRYANRAKSIKNKPKINEDPKDTMIREFKEEIERLKKLLTDQAQGSSLSLTGGVTNHSTSVLNNSHHIMASGDVINFASIAMDNSDKDNDGSELDFASIVGAPSQPKSSAQQQSPRSRSNGNHNKVIEKQIVEVKVEVERVPEDHLNRHRVSICYNFVLIDYIN
jgi:hypothetical protein